MAFDTHDIKIGNSLESTGSITHSGSVVLNGDISTSYLTTSQATVIGNLIVNNQPLNVAVFGIYATSSVLSYDKDVDNPIAFTNLPYISSSGEYISLKPGSSTTLQITRTGYYNIYGQLVLDFSEIPPEDSGYIGFTLDNTLYQANSFLHYTGSQVNRRYCPISFNSIFYIDSTPTDLQLIVYTKTNSFRIKEQTFIGTQTPTSYLYITSI